jgi:hypothetical protein
LDLILIFVGSTFGSCLAYDFDFDFDFELELDLDLFGTLRFRFWGWGGFRGKMGCIQYKKDF